MKKTIKLLDLDCGHCADKIQNAVKKIDGVTSVSVNFLSEDGSGSAGRSV